MDEVKVATTMFLITGSFFLCWIPLSIALVFVRVICPILSEDCATEKAQLIVGLIIMCAPIVNTVLDPIIYAFRMKPFRVGVKKLFTCKRQTLDQSDNSDSESVNDIQEQPRE